VRYNHVWDEGVNSDILRDVCRRVLVYDRDQVGISGFVIVPFSNLLFNRTVSIETT
jgi:hypothetical protein